MSGFIFYAAPSSSKQTDIPREKREACFFQPIQKIQDRGLKEDISMVYPGIKAGWNLVKVVI